jgi:hypothetical protein
VAIEGLLERLVPLDVEPFDPEVLVGVTEQVDGRQDLFRATGAVHAAAAFGVPVVEVYGPTVPEFGFFPYGPGIVVELEGLECRPCSLHGGNSCPEGHFRCTKDLTPDKVIEAVRELL